MSKKHRCSAFPQVDIKDSYGMLVPYLQRGMTLRDYFAAKAMELHGAALAKMEIDSEEAWDEFIANRAYKTADAMLAEREKEE